MLKYSDNVEKCPYCNRNVKYLTADTPSCKRTYCPTCLKDIEIIWKEKR